MHKLIALIIGSLLWSSYGLAEQRALIDSDWLFHLGDSAAAEATEYDDSQWARVGLPHDWSISQPRSPDAASGAGGGYFAGGVAWYRKSLQVPDSWRGKHVLIEFDGVYQNAQVWLNGRRLGDHGYGYTPFRFDITDHLNHGGPNVLAVRVDNSQQPNCRWYSGSGIYRHVWLAAVGDVYTRPDSVVFRTAGVDAGGASIAIDGELVNRSQSDCQATWTVRLLDVSGEQVAEAQHISQVAAGKTAPANSELRLAAAKLWSPDEPYLYRLEIETSVAGDVVDRHSLPCGVRTIELDPQRGMLLNGQSIKLFGGNVHDDNGPLGAAAFDDAEQRRAKLLKMAGFNAVRTAHNPPSPAFLSACDRLGLLVIDEAFDGWKKPKTKYDYSRRFDDHWQSDLLAMVVRDRNHPCVVMWSIGNEMYERGDAVAIERALAMVDVVRQLDPTRPVTAGVNGLGPRDWSELDPLFGTLDVAGYNYESARFADDRRRVSNRLMFSSESYANDLHASYTSVHSGDYVLGDFVWSAIDYLGEAGIGRVFESPDQIVPHWEGNHYPYHGALCGDIDICGHRKPISHFRNLAWNRGEMLYSAVVEPHPEGGEWGISQWAVPPLRESWTWPGYEGQTIQVRMASRWPHVALELNDKKIANYETLADDEYSVTVPVVYEPGTLRVLGLDEHGTIRDKYEMTTAGRVAQVQLASASDEWTADRQRLLFVDVRLCDANGLVCPNADSALHYVVEGPAEIMAIGSGDLASEESYQQNPRRAYRGRSLVVLRSTGESGTVRLTASGEGLRSDTFIIQSN